jgi:hypothetical protein
MLFHSPKRLNCMRKDFIAHSTILTPFLSFFRPTDDNCVAYNFLLPTFEAKVDDTPLRPYRIKATSRLSLHPPSSPSSSFRIYLISNCAPPMSQPQSLRSYWRSKHLCHISQLRWRRGMELEFGNQITSY